MKTQIIVEAEMTDEQCDALVSEIRHVSEIIGIKLAVAPYKLVQDGGWHLFSETFPENGEEILVAKSEKTKLLATKRRWEYNIYINDVKGTKRMWKRWSEACL